MIRYAYAFFLRRDTVVDRLADESVGEKSEAEVAVQDKIAHAYGSVHVPAHRALYQRKPAALGTDPRAVSSPAEHGCPGTDQIVAVRRMHYAEAKGFGTSPQQWGHPCDAVGMDNVGLFGLENSLHPIRDDKIE